MVVHAQEHVRGNIHTNGLENFWSLLKRGIGGTYVSVELFHLFRYVDEQAFRFKNRRDMDDSDRFDPAVRQIVGPRLTWAEITGNLQETQTSPINERSHSQWYTASATSTSLISEWKGPGLWFVAGVKMAHFKWDHVTAVA